MPYRARLATTHCRPAMTVETSVAPSQPATLTEARRVSGAAPSKAPCDVVPSPAMTPAMCVPWPEWAMPSRSAAGAAPAAMRRALEGALRRRAVAGDDAGHVRAVAEVVDAVALGGEVDAGGDAPGEVRRRRDAGVDRRHGDAVALVLVRHLVEADRPLPRRLRRQGVEADRVARLAVVGAAHGHARVAPDAGHGADAAQAGDRGRRDAGGEPAGERETPADGAAGAAHEALSGLRGGGALDDHDAREAVGGVRRRRAHEERGCQRHNRRRVARGRRAAGGVRPMRPRGGLPRRKAGEKTGG